MRHTFFRTTTNVSASFPYARDTRASNTRALETRLSNACAKNVEFAWRECNTWKSRMERQERASASRKTVQIYKKSRLNSFSSYWSIVTCNSTINNKIMELLNRNSKKNITLRYIEQVCQKYVYSKTNVDKFLICCLLVRDESVAYCCLCWNCFTLNSSIPGSTTGNAYKGLKFNDQRSEPTCEVLDPISTTTRIKLPQRNPIFVHGPTRREKRSYSVGCFLLSPTIFHCNIPAVARFVQVCTLLGLKQEFRQDPIKTGLLRWY